MRKSILSVGFLLALSAALWAAEGYSSREEIVREFNRIYYDSEVHGDTSWLGVPSLQNPCDNWIMQEIIAEVKPDFIIETGTFQGGTTLFYATVLSQVNPKGKVLSIDLHPKAEKASGFKVFQEHVEVIQGDCVSRKLIHQIRKRVSGHKVLVTLDSDHIKKHVLKEMRAYGPLVSVGSYLVVQDTNVNGHPVFADFGEGPYEAVQEFLKANHHFTSDKTKEKFLLTYYPNGYLKRTR